MRCQEVYTGHKTLLRTSEVVRWGSRRRARSGLACRRSPSSTCRQCGTRCDVACIAGMTFHGAGFTYCDAGVRHSGHASSVDCSQSSPPASRDAAHAPELPAPRRAALRCVRAVSTPGSFGRNGMCARSPADPVDATLRRPSATAPRRVALPAHCPRIARASPAHCPRRATRAILRLLYTAHRSRQ